MATAFDKMRARLAAEGHASCKLSSTDDDTPAMTEHGVLPAMHVGGKHLRLAPNYESVDVPGLFAAGGLSHGRDFKRSAGGTLYAWLSDCFLVLTAFAPELTRKRLNVVLVLIAKINPCAWFC